MAASERTQSGGNSRAIGFSPSTWTLVILAAGMFLRTAGITRSPLWFDESFSLFISRESPAQIVAALRVSLSPPAWELLLHVVGRLLGWSELNVRLPALMSSLLALWVFYRLTQVLLLSHNQQIFALALYALAPYQFWMAQDARMYAVFNLLFLVGILWVVEKRWLGVTAITGLMLWFHNTGLLFLPALAVMALLLHPEDWKRTTVAFFLGGVTWLPWAWIVFKQAGVVVPWYANALSVQGFLGSILAGVFVFTLPARWMLAALWLLIFSLLWLVLQLVLAWIKGFRFEDGKHTWEILSFRSANFPASQEAEMNRKVMTCSLAVLIFVPVGMFILSATVAQNVLSYRTISPLMAPLALGFAAALLPGQIKVISLILEGAWLFFLGIALLGWSPSVKGSNLREVVDLIAGQLQPGDVIYHAGGTTALPFWFYLPQARHYLLDEEHLLGEVDVGLANLPIAKAVLEDIPHERAWVVWSRDKFQKWYNPQADIRMANYIQDCQLVGQVWYWQMAETQVFLCGAR